MQLQESRDELEAAGVQLVGISYDSVETLKKFSDQAQITFPLLADEGSSTIRAYGIYNEEGNGYCHPGTFIVDQEGVVRSVLFHEGYVQRHSGEDMLEAVQALDSE